MKVILGAALLLLALTLARTPAEAKVYIDINSPGSHVVPIAVPEFRLVGPAPRGVGAEGADILGADLLYSGLFSLVPRTAYLDPAVQEGLTSPNIDFRRWNLFGAHLLVTGGVSSKQNQLRLELRLFDVLEGKMIIGRAYNGRRDQVREMMHRFASEIVRAIAGVEPVFDTRIAFVSDASGHKEVYTMDFDGYGAAPLTHIKSIALSPSWRTDGSEITFISYRSGRPELYCAGAGGNHLRLFHGSSGLSMSPCWSPDGKTVAAALSFGGNTDICLLDVSGNVLRRLTENVATDIEPSWSPDGKQLVFCSSRGGSPQIYTIDVASGEVRRLTFSGSYNSSPAWSPRGNRIAFTGRTDGHFHIFTMTPDGGDVRQLTSGSGSNESPSWSPDGLLLTFSSTREGKPRIYVMNADGSNQRAIGSASGRQTEPAWSGRLNASN
ncbi:MAG: Tol-Pal system beta propeller repeat protein TolB [Pseudomonadota bacterium]